MKVSRAWLQKYFDTELPSVEQLADALTFHSSEVEEVAGDMLDVKVLPDRACYALSHRGIAHEISAALKLPLKHDPLRESLPELPSTNTLMVADCDPKLAPRYMLAHIKDVKVGPSPAWLKDALESVGQRSINNIVDAANYVMLDLGQPLHAFDAAKVPQKDGTYVVTVRKAYEGERLTTLTGEEYVLPEDTLLIVDGDDTPIGIAGIKGGKSSEVNESTTDLLLEAANFDGTHTRRAAQALKLFTDASTRLQNRPSPDLVPYGLHAAAALIQEVAGGELVGGIDVYPEPQEKVELTVSLARVNGILGTTYTADDMSTALNRLALPNRPEGDALVINVPFERCDLRLPEDIAEEIGRILGYEHLGTPELPHLDEAPDLARFRGIERIKDTLLERGYIELSTQSFASAGDVELANPLQSDRPWLRAELAENMRDALTRAKRESPRTLGPESSLKLFEIGTVFTKHGEYLSLALGYEALTGKPNPLALTDDLQALVDLVPDSGLMMPTHDSTVAEVSLAATALEKLGEGYEPKQITLGAFRPYTVYPFALRDVAVWTPEGTEESEVALTIQGAAGELLLRMDLFDRFEKDTQISYAYRLVFEAPDRTLSDADLDPLMARVTEALEAKDGWKVR